MATTTKKPPTVKVPATVGGAIDYLFKVREARRVSEAAVEKMKQQETAIEDKIFGLFKKADLDGARGKKAQASISTSEVPTIEEWDKFAAHVLKTKALDLLQRRASVEAVRERWAAGKGVPGIGKFTKVRLHLTKLAK